MNKSCKYVLSIIFSLGVCLCASGEPSDKLIEALCIVESNNNVKAVGDNGKARGVLQLHKIYVKDASRFSKEQFDYEDAWSKDKSVKIVKAYLNHYGKAYERKTGLKPTDEVYARIHNGGPNGWNPKYQAKYANTSKYWAKVKKAMANVK